MPTAQANHVEQHEHRADRDRSVGKIECPEMRLAPVDVDEIDDVPGDRPIREVAERTAKDQRQADARQPFVRAELPARRARSR